MDEQSDQADYLSVQDASAYIGVSAQTLRRWDAAGKLKPVRHPVSGYRYYRRADLEPFRLEYRRAEMQTPTTGHLFQVLPANIEANERLREPQRAAHRAVREHFLASTAHAILQIPVGCGKTGVIATLPFGVADGRVLVIAPNLTIRKGIAEALDIASSKCFWTRTRVLTSVAKGPFVALLDGLNANLHDCNESHFVVTNIQQLASAADRWLPQFPPGYFDLILVDEGHHNAAPSWRKVFERFPEAKVVSLTATPFRSDQQRLAGEVIYHYPFTQAMMKGYIKQIHSINVAPAEISFTYRNDTRRHTLEEVLALREEQWFRKGVALAPECNRHIVDASIVRCEELRSRTGVRHQIIAVACSVDHARQVRALYEERGLKAREIYSEMEEDDQEAVLSELQQGRLDCIVQVQMLGEGFDHPPLSIAAIFRPFRSLSPYIQFVGRIMRVVHENEAGHPDNQGFVVSHVGLNNDEHWEDFRELDLDDQELFHRLLSATGEGRNEEGTGEEGGSPRRFDIDMLVDNEIVGHFIGQSFLNPEDDRVLERILNQEVPGTGLTHAELGVTKEALREKLRCRQKTLQQEPQEIPVSPQRHRQAVRRRLAERTNSVATRVLKDLALSTVGREVGRAVSRLRGQDNRAAVTELLNRRINEFLGIRSKQRVQLSADQAETALRELDRLGDAVRDEIRTAHPEGMF
jgi:DNA repair protein RadD